MFTNRNYRIFFAALWSFWSVIHTCGLVVWGFTIPLSIADSLVSNIGLILGALMLTYPIRYYPDKRKLWQLFLWTLAVTFVWHIATQKLLPLLPQSDPSYTEALSRSVLLRFAAGFFILFFSVLLRWFWQIAAEQRVMEDRQQQTEQLARKTELKALREQLHPHFLFNTLNSVSALIDIEPAKARRMVLQLSDFLRGTVNKQDKLQVNFGEEINQIKLYLDIEKVRFGHRLDVEFQLDETCNDCKFPAFVLQPLVENAVKFGLYDTTDNVCIRVVAVVENNFLVIKISNPFDSRTSANISGTGFGQQSVQRRLFLLYGRTDLFSTTSSGADSENDIYTVTLKIPLQ